MSSESASPSEEIVYVRVPCRDFSLALGVGLSSFVPASPAQEGKDDPGKQIEKDWKDARWNATEVGPFMTSALKLPDGSILPEDATPWLLMERFQMRQEKYAEAIVPQKVAARRAPQGAMVQDYLGKALAAAGRREEAREPLGAALRGNPPDDIRKEVESILAGK